jgi:predicted nucleic acid-binding protein
MLELQALGFRPLDALHLACAESGGADVLLTTDDRLRRLASRVSAQLRVRVENPLTWLEEVTGE